MKQSDLNRAVARATGESVSTIKRLGFLLADPSEPLQADADQLGPWIIDWDELAAQQHQRQAALACPRPRAAAH